MISGIALVSAGTSLAADCRRVASRSGQLTVFCLPSTVVWSRHASRSCGEVGELQGGLSAAARHYFWLWSLDQLV